MAKGGFTTGCLYKTERGLEEIIKLYHALGADAIEVSFPKHLELMNFNLTQQTIQDIRKYDFVTLHAPWKEIRYKDNIETKKLFEKLEYLSENLNAKGIVLHPDTIDDFSVLEKSGLPFLLENMDPRKVFGTKAEDFEKLKQNYNLGFVLDLFHAYENDNSMNLAIQFLDIMGNKLSHFHVSGPNEEHRHKPTYSSTNKDSIIKILELKKEIPRISEGIILSNVEEVIRKELEFLKNVAV